VPLVLCRFGNISTRSKEREKKLHMESIHNTCATYTATCCPTLQHAATLSSCAWYFSKNVTKHQLPEKKRARSQLRDLPTSRLAHFESCQLRDLPIVASRPSTFSFLWYFKADGQVDGRVIMQLLLILIMQLLLILETCITTPSFICLWILKCEREET